MTEYECGNLNQGETYLDRLLEAMEQAPGSGLFAGAAAATVIPLAAQITGVPQRLEIARDAGQSVLSSPTITPFISNFANSGLALQAVVNLDTQACAEYYPTLLDTRRDPLAAWFMAGDRLLGLLAQTMDNLDQAAAHFEDSLTFCHRAVYRPELAWTCCDYADSLLQRNEPGDREQAMSLLDESLAYTPSWSCGP